MTTSKQPATKGARALLKKLEALANAPGTPEEGQAAKAKLDRLNRKYDFSQKDVTREVLFAGHFTRAPHRVAPVIELSDFAIASNVKWAIENSTGIPCGFQGNILIAEATSATAEKLKAIAETIAAGFRELWNQFRNFPHVSSLDRDLFFRGLYDGMMNDEKPQGEALPHRAAPPEKTRRAKRKAVRHAAGIGLHPYSVAVELGTQIRFNVPLPEITSQLETMKSAPKEIA